jgi:hypothetical protein
MPALYITTADKAEASQPRGWHCYHQGRAERLLTPSTCVGMADTRPWLTQHIQNIPGRCRHHSGRQNEHPVFFQSMSWHLATAFDFFCNHVLLYPISTSFRHQKKNQPGKSGSYPNHFFLEFFIFFLRPVCRVFHSCVFVTRTNIVHHPLPLRA